MHIPPRRPFLAILLLLAAVATAPLARAAEPSSTTQATQPAAATMPSWSREQDVIYGRTAGTALTLDIFTPKDAKPNGAAVVFVVSGGWVSSHDFLDSPMIGMFIGPFLRHGYTVFGVVPGSQPKFTIPEIAQNLDKSVRFIRANADRWKIDADRIGITGGSAGGHLSLLQATRPSPGKRLHLDPLQRASGRVRAAAVLFPPTDFLNYREPGKNIMDDPMLDPFSAAFDFEEMSAKEHKLVDVSKARHTEILRNTSPAQHVDKNTPPCMIVHGDKDELVPIQQTHLFIDKLKEAGVPAELVVKKGAGHGWAKGEVEIELMAQFFDKHLLEKEQNSD